MIAIAGGKGGVGKTIISATMAIAIAEKGYKTIVVDADFGGANLHQLLGILTPAVTIKNFLDDKPKDINELVLETPIPNLFLLAGASGVVGLANLGYGLKQKLIRNFHSLDADYVVLDLGAGTTFDQLDFFLQADVGIVVITPEPMAIQDGYHFVKLCLYRRLARLFGHDPEIGNWLKAGLLPVASRSSSTIQELTNQLRALESPLLGRWMGTIRGFCPKVVMNMIETEQDLNECLALQIAVRDLLSVEIDRVSFIRYDEELRCAAQKMRPDLLMSPGGQAAGLIRQLAEQLLSNGAKYNSQAVEDNHREMPSWFDRQPDEEELICSVLCSLWGDCRMQSGGYPCRIKVVGFFNQK